MKFHLPPPGRRLRRILTLLGQAALCCVLTAARLGGLYAPFSLAAAAAAGPGLPGLLSLLLWGWSFSRVQKGWSPTKLIFMIMGGCVILAFFGIL